MESGKYIDEIEVKLNLTTFKPLHVAWIMEFYDLMTSDEAKSVTKNGQNASGITGVIESGLANLPSINPFANIDPLITEPTISNNESPIPEEEIVERRYAGDWHDDSDEEWELQGQDETRSAFNIFEMSMMMENEHLSLVIELSVLNVFPFFFILHFVSKIKKMQAYILKI